MPNIHLVAAHGMLDEIVVVLSKLLVKKIGV